MAQATIFSGSRPLLMAILDEGSSASADAAILGGVDLIQIRARGLSGRALSTLAKSIGTTVAGRCRVIVNSRPDVAFVTASHGVHLPEKGLDVREIRRAFPELLIGVSRHDRAGLERAVDEGADYAILGPVFPTPGKEQAALGLDGFAEILEGLSIPVLAVGGVTARNATGLVAAGARGVAAIRPFENPDTARSEALGLRRALDQYARPSVSASKPDGSIDAGKD